MLWMTRGRTIGDRRCSTRTGVDWLTTCAHSNPPRVILYNYINNIPYIIYPDREGSLNDGQIPQAFTSYVYM
jgi:hypothetical protein